MSMNDPIADMLTRIRNGQRASKASVAMPSSKIKKAIAQVLLDEGYITGFSVDSESKPTLSVELKYFNGSAVIEKIQRVSRNGLRIFRNKEELPSVNSGLSIAIISTSKGLMTDRAARAAGIGGEVLCIVA